MKCPKCKTKMSVVETRPSDEFVARRRKCPKCKYSVHTMESIKLGDEAWYEAGKALRWERQGR